MLGRDGIRLEIALVALAPDGVEALRVKPRHEFRTRRVHDTVRRIKIVGLTKEAAMVRRMPVLAGVDAGPVEREEAIDGRHDFGAAGDGQLLRAQRGEAALHIDDQEGAVAQVNGLHRGAAPTPRNAALILGLGPVNQ